MKCLRILELTQAVSDEKPVVAIAASPSVERITERKTIVYETRTDTTVIKVAAEKVKTQLFGRFGIMKPRPEEIKLVSFGKYYEPYMIINGRYSIDYYRKCVYTVKVDKKVKEIILLNQKLEPIQPTDPSMRDHNVIKLEGEERLMNELAASLILDKSGRDVALTKLPSAPSERNPEKILAAFGVKEIAPEVDLEVIRSKILKRPKDINRLVSELFEVKERAVIYTPRFKVRFKNMRTGEEKTAEFDGVTAESIQHRGSISSFLEKLA